MTSWGLLAVAAVVAARGWVLLPMRLQLLRRLIGIRLVDVARVYAVPLLASAAIGVAAWFMSEGTSGELAALVRLPIVGLASMALYVGLIRLLAPESFAEIIDLGRSFLPGRS